MEPKRITLTIESRPANVALVGSAVHELCSTIPLLEDECDQVELSVVEAVNNAVEHANAGNELAEVSVSVEISNENLLIRVADGGSPIPAENLVSSRPSPLDFEPTDVQNLPEGGLGLAIINMCMDEVRYEAAEGRNVMTMRKSIRSSAA